METLDHIDARREAISALIPAQLKSELGQFMTPSVIASFMAGLFSSSEGKAVRLLDAGAGIGSLTWAFLERLTNENPRSVYATAWELDPTMRMHLEETFEGCQSLFDSGETEVELNLEAGDFILDAAQNVRFGSGPRFTHAILNPPYRKLKSDSDHRRALKRAGIETSNLYTAFVALALLMLEDGGELVAITPRSFCNGTYFKPFRRILKQFGSIEQVHVFESRTQAFKGDEVLQENIIFKVVKGSNQAGVILSSSSDATFVDKTERLVPFEQIIKPDDEDLVIHLPTEADCPLMSRLMKRFTHTLEDLGIAVSTGPVVDFRLKEHLRKEVESDCVPLVYCLHFVDGWIQHPKETKKANAIAVNSETEKWLMPSGHYVCVRRLSSKEEKRRIVPAFFDPSRVVCDRVGFDNHMNVFHQAKAGMSAEMAKGLYTYLGSTFADRWFRRFNGHTQVNAGDLRALRYPSRETLIEWGKGIGEAMPSQQEIDQLVEGT